MKNKIKRFTRSIRTRVTAWIFGCLLAMILIGVSLGYWQGYLLVRKTVSQDYKEIAEGLELNFSRTIEQRIVRLQGYVSDPDLIETIRAKNVFYQEMSADSVQQYLTDMDAKWTKASVNSPLVNEYTASEAARHLSRIVGTDDNVVEIFVTDKMGGLVLSSNKTSDFNQGDEEWWQKADNDGKGKVYIDDVSYDESAKTMSIAIAIPVMKDNSVVGICKEVLNFDSFIRPLREQKMGQTGHVLLIDDQGNLLFHEAVQPYKEKLGIEEIKLLNNKAEQWGSAFSPYHHKKMFLAWVKVKNKFLAAQDISWLIVLSQEEREVFHSLYTLVVQGVGLFAILIICAIPIGYFLGGGIVRPIKELHAAIARISSGDLGYRINIKTNDEMEDLVFAFNKMTKDLQNTTTSVVNLNREVAERINAEESLRREKEFAESMFMTAQVIMLVLDKKGCIVNFNPYMQEKSGYTLAEVKGKSWFETFIPVEDQPRIRELFSQSLQGHCVKGGVNPILRKDGQPVLIEWYDSILRDKDGQIEGVVAIGQDITERKKMEDQVNRSLKDAIQMQGIMTSMLDDNNKAREKLDYIAREWSVSFDAMADGVSIHAPDYTVLNVNQTLCQMLGKTRAELIGQKCYHLFHASNSPIVDCPIEKSRQTLKKEYAEIYEPTIDRWLAVSTAPIMDGNGVLIKIVHVVRDITERRKLEDHVRQQERLLRNVINTIPGFVFWKNRESVYMGCNENFAKAAGVTNPEGIIGKTDYDLAWKKEEADHYRQDDREVMENNRPKLDLEESRQQAQGRPMVVLTSRVPLHDEKGSVTGILGNFMDITGIKQMEAKLQKSHDDLEKMVLDLAVSNKKLKETQTQLLQSEKMSAVGQLSSGIAHEIKNPLSIILLAVDSLEVMAQANEKMKERVGMMRRAAERANEVVLKLLQFSHVSVGEFKELDLHEHLDTVFVLVHNVAKFKSAQLIKDYSAKSLKVHGDPILLEQVFLNIISNAVDAVSHEGEVRVKTWMQEGKTPGKMEAVVEIADNGLGIAPEDLSKIFEPFFTTKDPGKGTGLGLSTAFMIVEQHQGRMQVESQLGKGTTFRIYLPTGNGTNA